MTARAERPGRAVFHLEVPIQVIHRPVYHSCGRTTTGTDIPDANTVLAHDAENPQIHTEAHLNLPFYVP